MYDAKLVLSDDSWIQWPSNDDAKEEQEAMSRKHAQEEEDERLARELCTTEEQEAVSHKSA